MSEVFKVMYKEYDTIGTTQRILNSINDSDLQKFERGYRYWLARNSITPPINSPSSHEQANTDATENPNKSFFPGTE